MIGGIVFSYFLSTVLAQTCHPDWLLFQESCYGFGEEALSWGDADDICKSFGGRLAEIETTAESNFLKNECIAKHGHFYWLGGTDIFHEGVWRWASTGELINSNTDWASGEPNDYGGQDCVGMLDAYGYQWGDAACSTPELFICEADPLDEPIVG